MFRHVAWYIDTVGLSPFLFCFSDFYLNFGELLLIMFSILPGKFFNFISDIYLSFSELQFSRLSLVYSIIVPLLFLWMQYLLNFSEHAH